MAYRCTKVVVTASLHTTIVDGEPVAVTNGRRIRLALFVVGAFGALFGAAGSLRNFRKSDGNLESSSALGVGNRRRVYC